MSRIIGIIGYGNMGSAIGQQLSSKYQVLAFDRDTNKTRGLLNIKTADDAVDLVNKSENIILAVKPQDLNALLTQIREYIDEKLVISIAAGISTGYIQRCLGKIRVIRVMPNLPAKIGRGMICLCKGIFATNNDIDFVKGLFEHLGQTILIEENLMDAATAISGSGPGFFYHLIQDKQQQDWEEFGRKAFIPKLSLAARRIGFSPEQAHLLSTATVEGSTALLTAMRLSPAELKKQVASKGGTTEAGLKVLNSIESLEASVRAALRRAKELSKK